MKKRRFPPLFGLLAAFLVVPGASAGEWIALASPTPAQTDVRLESAVPSLTSASFVLSGLEVSAVQIDQQTFSRLVIPAAQELAGVGQPQLPVLRRLVEVPRGASVSVHLETTLEKIVPLLSLGGPGRIVPVQPPVPKLPGAEKNRRLSLDQALYSQDAFWPAEPVAVVGRSVIRGREFALVEIRPVVVNPVSGLLKLTLQGQLVIEASGGDPCAAVPDLTPARESNSNELWLNAGLPRPAGCPTPTKSKGAGEGAEGMLVIVHDSLVDALKPFTDWKSKTGFKVVIKKTSELGVSPTDANVKDAIQNAYNTWSNPALGFVLLAGDTNLVPKHQGNGGGESQATDNWFACVDGSDYLPDVGMGRLSARTSQQMSDIVDKLLTYERASFPASSWIKKADFIGTGDGGHISLIEGTHDWCIDSFYTPNEFQKTSWSHGYSSSDRHYNTYDATTADISASINEGRMIVNYSGHGSETGWAGPTDNGGYEQSDIRANTNSGMYPFVIGNACLTGSYDIDECMGETWLRVPKKGAIAYLGASNSSYWDEDDYFQRRLHTHIFPMDNTPALSSIIQEAKRDLYTHYGDVTNVRYYFDIYNLMGEPSLLLWTRPPRDLVVSYDEQIPLGSNSFAVSVKRNGTPAAHELVAVRKVDEGIAAAGYTDASGNITLPLDPPVAETGNLEITVTGHDDRPFEGTSQAIPADTAWLVFRQHEVDDSAAGCDHDGIPDVGELSRFILTIENIGSKPALDTIITLGSNADVAVSESPFTFGTIAPHTKVQIPMTVQVGLGTQCQELATFQVGMACAGCDPREDSFIQQLNTDQTVERTTENLEHGGSAPAGWTHGADPVTADNWQVTSTANHTAGGRYSWYTPDPVKTRSSWLVSPVLQPKGKASYQFYQWVDLTPNKSGALLEITTDGGAHWQDLGPSITKNPYNGTLGSGTQAQKVWTGATPGFVLTEVDLSAYAGKTVQIRFRIGGTSGVGSGWWIDDTALESVFLGCHAGHCAIPGTVSNLRLTVQSSEIVLTWAREVVAQRYKVFRSTNPQDPASFVDITAQESDDTDTTFRDSFAGPFAAYTVQAVGPDGAGPR